MSIFLPPPTSRQKSARWIFLLNLGTFFSASELCIVPKLSILVSRPCILNGWMILYCLKSYANWNWLACTGLPGSCSALRIKAEKSF